MLDCSKEVNKNSNLMGEFVTQDAALPMLKGGHSNAKLPTCQLFFADFPSSIAQRKTTSRRFRIGKCTDKGWLCLEKNSLGLIEEHYIDAKVFFRKNKKWRNVYFLNNKIAVILLFRKNKYGYVAHRVGKFMEYVSPH